MLHEIFSREEISHALPGSATALRLTSYARPRSGLLGDDGDRWAVLILPGGGYELTSPTEGEPVALAFVAAGVQAFVLDYSVAPDVWPQAFLETAAAVAFLRKRAERYGFSPDKIAVCGFSAGGHLAGSLANLWQHAVIGQVLGVSPRQVRPDAAILCYPVISADCDASGSIRRLVDGGPVPAYLSLEKSVTDRNPPTFLWSTWTDGTVPVQNSLRYADALLRAGTPCEAHLYGQGPHAMGTATAESARSAAHIDPHVATWVPLCLEWLKGL